MFLIPTDFNGYYDISTNSFSSEELEIYIKRLEPIILRKVLGVELYNLFVADLDTNNVPTTPIYTAIYNAFSMDDNRCVVESTGMIEMLKGFIYYNFMIDSAFTSTINGKVKNRFANSEEASYVEYRVTERYNYAIDTVEAIQWFIRNNKNDYPKFNGQEINKLTWRF